MPNNPIKYSDLFDSGLIGKVNSLTEAIEKTSQALDTMVENAKAKAGAMAQVLSAASPGSPQGQQEIARLSQEVEKLRSQIESLRAAKEAAAKASKAAAAAEEEEVQARIMARQATKQYTDQVKADIAAVQLDEQARKRLSSAAELQKMSYNELSTAYSQLVAMANNMHARNEQEIKDRQQMIQMAGQVRQQMIQLKEGMGNYTLSVGNYAKAFNDLSLAMQQIVRETPTVTMGARMYFMAVSNNLPILTDQIRLYNQRRKADLDEIKAIELKIAAMRQEGATAQQLAEQQAILNARQAESIPVGKALLQSLFSWQTAMILGITLLTMYGDKIFDWIASVFSASDATKAWREAQEDLNQTFSDGDIAAAKAEAQADVLYRIATDESRALEDRIKAGEILKNQYEDYFGDLSTEEIMLGRAAKAHEDLTKALMNQAIARAYLDKITELYGKRIEAQAKVDEAQATAAAARSRADAVGYTVNMGAYTEGGMANYAISPEANAAARAEGQVEKAQDALNALDDEIQKLIDSMPVDGLMDMLVNGGGRRGKDPKVVDPIVATIDNLKYIRQAREAEINNIADDTERELALTRFRYENELADLRAFAEQQQVVMITINELERQLAQETTLEKRNLLQEQINDLKRQWDITEEGVQAVNDTIVAKEEELTNRLAEIRRERTERLVAESRSILKLQLDLADKRAENNLEGDALDEQKLQNQIQYWTAMVASLEAFNDGSKEATLNLEIARETLRGLLAARGGGGEGENILERIFGKDYNKFLRGLERVLKKTADNIKEIISLYEEMAKAAVEAAEQQVRAAEKVYDAELNAYENGYANNVEFARKELELRRQRLAEAQAEEERYARMQERVDSITQVSSMITAAANLYKSASKAGPIGVGVATAAILAMFASYAAAKVQARAMAGSAQQYGEGGTEYIGYGGTHASGHDVDFGHMPDGRPRRIERGETVAVINARQTSKYGYPVVAEIIDSINKGQFVEKYMTAFSGSDGEFTMNMSSTFDSPYLSDISRDLKAIRKGGEFSESTLPDGTRIVRYKNYIRRIKS